jgi:hypothetical protein
MRISMAENRIDGPLEEQERIDGLQEEPERSVKAKRAPRKDKASIAAAKALEAEEALTPRQRAMSPSWRRFYAAVSRQVGE